MWFGLARRRQLILPTWKGWILFLLIALGVFFLVLRGLYPFLAHDDRLGQADIVIVEGWIPDLVLRLAKEELDANRCDFICAAGVDLDKGHVLSEWKDWATLSAETLKGMGVPPDKLIVAPGGPIQRHRTYKGFEAAKAKLEALGVSHKRINIVSEGAHARRSRMVAHKIFGKDIAIGMIVADPETYSPASWWKSSSGMKSVVMELIASTFEQFADSGR